MTGKTKPSSVKRKKGAKKSLRSALLMLLLKVAVVFTSLFFVFVFAVYLGLFGPIPSKSSLGRIKNNSATLVLDHQGRLVGKYFLQNRMTIGEEHISQHVKNALVATEDSRFFKHKGLDFVSLGRVVVKSILLGNRNQGGGSTISQQLARNLYPRLDFGKLTMPINKVREIFISARLEKVYNKEDILALYLNTVPFGDNVYGIEVASQHFFGQPSSTLNPAEAATLIGVLAANTAYNPRLNPEKSKERRNVVLGRMEDQGFLSKSELEDYLNLPIELNYRKMDYNSGPAPYFVEHLRPQIQKILTDQYGDEFNLFTDGLRITTTLDSSLQEYANQAVNSQMTLLQKEFDAHWSGREPWSGNSDILWTAIKNSDRYQGLIAAGKTSEEAVQEMRKPVKTNVFNGSMGKGEQVNLSPLDSIKQSLKTLQTAFFAMNPQNGQVLAWVGGTNFEYFKYDHIKANRQVGSTFKPILYTVAIQSGIEPCEYISNELRTYADYQDWTPENSDGNHDGWYSVKGGLVNSVNTISAAIINQTGIRPVIEQARKMGIRSPIPEVPSISLGAADLSLGEMVTAYSAFANQGLAVEPVSLLKIEDWQGTVLWEAEPAEPMESAMNSETARLMVEMMKGVVERGTGSGLRSVYGLRSDLAGKTGTTQDNADGWFIGYNPVLVAGAWVGADNPGIHFRTTTLGQGAHTGLPIFGKFLQQIERDPEFRTISQAKFPPLSEELASKLSCLDYTLEDPNMNFIEKLFDRFIQSDTTKSRKLQDPTIIKQEEEKKEGFFKRLRETFRKKKGN